MLTGSNTSKKQDFSTITFNIISVVQELPSLSKLLQKPHIEAKHT